MERRQTMSASGRPSSPFTRRRPLGQGEREGEKRRLYRVRSVIRRPRGAVPSTIPFPSRLPRQPRRGKEGRKEKGERKQWVDGMPSRGGLGFSMPSIIVSPYHLCLSQAERGKKRKKEREGKRPRLVHPEVSRSMVQAGFARGRRPVFRLGHACPRIRALGVGRGKRGREGKGKKKKRKGSPRLRPCTGRLAGE